MKRLHATLLLAAVSWALAGTPARAAEAKSHTMVLAKKHHKKHHNKKHKKHAAA